jgi:hypothetical protein
MSRPPRTGRRRLSQTQWVVVAMIVGDAPLSSALGVPAVISASDARQLHSR